MLKITCSPMLPVEISVKPKLIDMLLATYKKWVVEPKVDGIRIITVITKQGITCSTRNGTVIDKLSQYITVNMDISDCIGYVLDGEMFYKDIRTTQSIVHNSNIEPVNLRYYIFDCYPLTYCNQICNISFLKRKQILTSIVKNYDTQKIILVKYSKLSPIRNVNMIKEDMFNLAQQYVNKGYEGIVLKKIDSPYVHTRSTNWIKVKPFKSLDLRCIGIERSNRNTNMLGAIIVDVCGVQCRVGSGFTNKQRVQYIQNPDLIVGKIVEVRYIETTPSGKLRFPIFVRIRYDKQTPDC